MHLGPGNEFFAVAVLKWYNFVFILNLHLKYLSIAPKQIRKQTNSCQVERNLSDVIGVWRSRGIWDRFSLELKWAVGHVKEGGVKNY